jgi:MFS transporter, FSR family, fosmidomycin resistance protein
MAEHAVWYREAMPDRVLDASASARPGSARPIGALVVTNFSVILSLSFCHLLNDTMQSLVPALYPILKASYGLSFAQVGLITLAFQFTASMLQPVVGMYTDRRPQPYSLTVGISITLLGLILMSRATSYPVILLAAMLIGMGSSIFHPEASRVARMAAGGRYGLAQSLFQAGGNIGSASGPLLAAFIVVPHGQRSIVWFSGLALVALLVLIQVGGWYARHRAPARPAAARRPRVADPTGPAALPQRRVVFAVAMLVTLLFSKNVYSASLGSYYTLYLIDKFHLPVQTAQFYLFAFLAGIVAGTIAGGSLADRIGRIPVIWFSILGAFPFALMLPHANLFWTGVLAVTVAFIMASAFSAILVYAQELMPGRVGLAAGMFYGFSFGLGGLGAAVLGRIADLTSIATVYRLCPFLLLLGLLTAFLPRQPGPSR